MPIYGSPLGLHVRAIVFQTMALALEGEYRGRSDAEAAGEALRYLRTAIVHDSLMKGRRKRDTRSLEFSLIEWCGFRADSRYRRDKKRILALMRTLRRLRKNLAVSQKARVECVQFFGRLSDECSSKGDSSSMTIGDSDD